MKAIWTAALLTALALGAACSGDGNNDGGMDARTVDYALIEGPVTKPIVDMQPSPDLGPADLGPADGSPAGDLGPLPDLLADVAPAPDGR